MARNTGPVCRMCRREGMKLFLKGLRCDTDTCAFERRQTPPGMHTFRRGKLTDYGIHLREKQKVKHFYGVLERQFRCYFQRAERTARRLRGAGVARVVVLAGGEPIIRRQGKPGLMRRGSGAGLDEERDGTPRFATIVQEEAKP